MEQQIKLMDELDAKAEITLDFVNDVMEHVRHGYGEYDNGRVLIKFYGGGSYDRKIVYCENIRIADIASKNWTSIWTKWVTKEQMNTDLGKVLVHELRNDFTINWHEGAL